MYSKRLMQLLFVALSFMATAQALRLDADFFRVAEAAHAGRQPARRADNSAASSGGAKPTGDASTKPSAQPSAQVSSTPGTTSSAPSPSPTTSSPTPTKSTPSPTDKTSTPPTTSSTPTTSKDTPTPSPTNSPTDKTTSSPTDKTTTPPDSTTSTTQPVSTSTFVTTFTEADGSTTAVTSETTTVPTGSLSSSGSGSKASGMSTSTRNIIIGVVVGVGGAIVLVVIGLVALRIHRRKQAAKDSGNGLNDYDPNYGNAPVGALEKPDNTTGAAAAGAPGRSPFQSTLESYHTPTQVNTASNF
ncbi:cell wall protein [Sporothrix schenckii 1099-18]|uniref:Mid2 domain-containing protein n=2 Tax=Sporothrix schenckii TaxID=29908 RepID=U7PXB8_SPOS1|nr:cell wall protein [Sporothrix schenckii 1099-18]ERS99576.1 hypothetical protein HMPREF1624_04781 [Sporothrix schenckii ATCC 58251]KJR82673.1 cell wall protein [Sporothrix schenckii 1099-18]